MLSTTNPSSSVQQRRQVHRRQNSLEVPMLATHMPASGRRPGGHHRRGLSLEHAMSFLPRQDVSIHTNQQRPQSQHSTQETQQHRPYQPGPFAMDPNQQQQQQQQFFQPAFMQQEFASAEQAKQAIQNLEQHIQSVYRTYGYVPHSQAPQSQTQMPETPIIVATRPTTPPQYGQNMAGHGESVLLDVSPMPTAVSSMAGSPMSASFSNVPILSVQESFQDNSSVYQESFAGDYVCTPSYAGSMVDPSSPLRSPVRHVNAMPTVYEAISPVPSHATFAHDSMMISSTGTPSLGYYAESPHRPMMSPREAMLQNLDIDASIEDTGVSQEEVQRYISPQDYSDGKWTCLFDGCDKKFGRKENIRAHVQTHLGDRQFKCNHCLKCFVRQHDLKRHAKIHSGDKPHKCPCGNGFARQDALTRHRQRGVCEGALPGFERRDVRRGRPRKTRPEMADRLEKATLTRELNARRGSEFTYASSSASERDYPDTPQNGSDDFDDDAFNNMTVDAKFNGEHISHSTPPTSPYSVASPAKKDFKRGSVDHAAMPMLAASRPPPPSSPPQLPHSPPPSSHCPSVPFGQANNTFTFENVNSKPLTFIEEEIFSPTASSSSVSDMDDFSPKMGAESAFMGADDMLDFNASMYAGDALFNASLDAWLEGH